MINWEKVINLIGGVVIVVAMIAVNEITHNGWLALAAVIILICCLAASNGGKSETH